jgi:hypothetical protein
MMEILLSLLTIAFLIFITLMPGLTNFLFKLIKRLGGSNE